MYRLDRNIIADHRGFLTRIWCSEELAELGWKSPIAQINHTSTKKEGTVRGLHYQIYPHKEAKLVSCIRGAVWDVAVDLRKKSPTFLRWHGEEISAKNGNAMLIPEGMAHGFQALTADVEIIYCHSTAYAPDFERGLNPRDPLLAIDWPKNIVEISEKDKRQQMLTTNFKGI